MTNDEAIPCREDLENLFLDMDDSVEPPDPLFDQAVDFLADGFAAPEPPPWLHQGMLDCVCFKVHLFLALGLARRVE